MSQHAARAYVPDEEVEHPPVVRDLKASLRLLRQGRILGWVDAMMETGVPPRDAQHEREMRERYTKRAEAKYAEIGR